MKNKLSLLAIVLGLFVPSFVFAQTITPSSVSSVTDVITSVDPGTAGWGFSVFLPDTVEAQNYYTGTENVIDENYSSETWENVIGDPSADDEFPGGWRFLLVNFDTLGEGADSPCDSSSEVSDYELCLLDPAYQGVEVIVTFGEESETPISPIAASAAIAGVAVDFGASSLVILAAIVGILVALLVFRWGWRKTVNLANEPGSFGYNSRRGSGRSSGNFARMESQGSSGKKINLLG